MPLFTFTRRGFSFGRCCQAFMVQHRELCLWFSAYTIIAGRECVSGVQSGECVESCKYLSSLWSGLASMSLSDQLLLSKGRGIWDECLLPLKPFFDLPSLSLWDAFPASQLMFSLDSRMKLAAHIASTILEVAQACLALDTTRSKGFQHLF